LLSNLRRIQPAVPIVYDDVAIGLDATLVATDLSRLLAVTDTSTGPELAAAIAAYRGPFGVDLETDDSEFDEWLRGERQRIDDVVVPPMDRLVRQHSAAGRHQDALTQANVLLGINPLREETHRLIIAEEAVLSGRASAMQRYEGFRILLRDELAIRPEQATLDLIDRLRINPAPAAPVAADTDGDARPTATVEISEPKRAKAAPPPLGRRWAAMAAGAVICLALAIWGVADYRSRDGGGPYAGEGEGRAAVIVLPFESVATDAATTALRQALAAETVLAFARSNRVSQVDVVDGAGPDAAGTGQPRPRYRVKTRLSGAGASVRADVSLIDSGNGVSVWSASIPVTDGEAGKFAREVHGYVVSEIVLNQARMLSKQDRDSTEAMIWRARAAQMQGRLGAEDDAAVELYRAILARQPDHLQALLGLSNIYVLRVARNQSADRAGDLRVATDLVQRAKPQAPNSSDLAFREGMLNKLRGNFERALADFERAMRLDPTHWNASAQCAHVQMFLGQLETAFELMQQAAARLLPDLGAAETAYLAGETALAAGHPEQAVSYLAMAVSGNPTVSRIHALHAVALYMAGRTTEASDAAREARNLNPAFTPQMMAQRGGPTASPRYVEARSHFVDAYRAAWGQSAAR
jgi:Flp pilus assembly protein TadD/DNA-binding SARP family transcriptional activator